MVSQGVILAFIDADCIADPKWLEVIVTELREMEVAGSLAGMCAWPLLIRRSSRR
jgi:hypothetical protein